MFNKLLEGVREAGKIRRNEKAASRTFDFNEIDVKAVREKIGHSQAHKADLLRREL